MDLLGHSFICTYHLTHTLIGYAHCHLQDVFCICVPSYATIPLCNKPPGQCGLWNLPIALQQR